VLLRVFFLNLLSYEQARDYLIQRAERAAAQHAELRRLEESLGWDEGMLSINGRLALEYGLRLATMTEDWARWAAGQIGAPEQPPGPEAPSAGADPEEE
jgi:hypothetical protein